MKPVTISPTRVPQLDLLRGIAVLLVISHHYPYFRFLHRTGWAGVDLFFVLSGFLISGLLFSDWKKHGHFSVGRFFIRRGFKIYPPFYIFLLLTLPVAFAFHPGQTLRRFAIECFFLQDYFPHLWNHTWSLAVEEQFYILLPLLLVGLSKLQPSTTPRAFGLIPGLAFILLAGCLVLRWYAHARDLSEILGPLHFRADSLFVGVALGYWFHFHGDSFRAFSRWWLVPLIVALLVPLAVFGRDVSALPFVFTSNLLAFALLLCWILPRDMIRLRLVERIGLYSYSIYLWHFLVTMIARLLPLSFPMFCVSIVASCATGAYMSDAIERRALAVRDRLFPATAVLHVEASPATPSAASGQRLAPKEQPHATLSPDAHIS
jgi:peptidoglycan/LPS O-acetylase OafA/YrhL